MADRALALAGRAGVWKTVSLTPAAPALRLSLRAGTDAVSALSKALGLTLPLKPKTSAEKAGRAALWLGPDEWLVIGGETLPDFAKVKALYSAVDISHRNVAIVVEGAGAENCLNAGCPQDLSLRVFPVGACSRTILGKAEIVLWRTGPETFRVECWRSFSDYVFSFLEDAARGLD